MSKWRPSENCLYAIADIHGMHKQLDLILKRILPLRNTGGNLDKIVFLGDYIDRGVDSHLVIDRLIKLKKEYPDQVITLLGNHELLLLESCSLNTPINRYKMWMQNGGEETLIGYLKRAKSDIENPYLIRRESIPRFIPDDHMEFFKTLLAFYETPEYIFVHGGCDPFIPLSKQDPQNLAWDRSVYNTTKKLFGNKVQCPWIKTIVTGHNGDPSGNPFILDKFIMLDGSADQRVYVFEMQSRTGFWARKNNKRLVSIT